MADKLWDFAVACYRGEGVAEVCLRLQENSSADVNMLLAAAWLASQQRTWDLEEVLNVIALCAGWRRHCVLPLRAVRRYLKGQFEANALYTQAKMLELEAEKQQLRQIEAALQQRLVRTTNLSAAAALANNLDIYFEYLTAADSEVAEDDRNALNDVLTRGWV